MEAIAAAFVPLVLVFIMLSMIGRMALPGHALSVFVGHLARDFFWLFVRAVGFVLSLPFRILNFLLSDSGHRRHRRRTGRRYRRY